MDHDLKISLTFLANSRLRGIRHSIPDPRSFPALGADNHYIGTIHRRGYLDNLTFGAGCARPHVALAHIHAVYHHTIFITQHPRNRACFAVVFPSNDPYRISFFNLKRHMDV